MGAPSGEFSTLPNAGNGAGAGDVGSATTVNGPPQLEQKWWAQLGAASFTWSERASVRKSGSKLMSSIGSLRSGSGKYAELLIGGAWAGRLPADVKIVIHADPEAIPARNTYAIFVDVSKANKESYDELLRRLLAKIEDSSFLSGDGVLVSCQKGMDRSVVVANVLILLLTAAGDRKGERDLAKDLSSGWDKLKARHSPARCAMRGLEKILIGMYEMERPVLEEVLPSHAVDPEVLPQRVSTTRLLASEEDVTKVLEAAGAAIPEKSVRLRDIYFDGRGRELRERGLYVRTREEVQPGTLQGNGEERGSDQGPDKCWELRSVGGVLIRGEEEVTRTLDIGLDELRPVAEVVTNRALHRGSRVQFLVDRVEGLDRVILCANVDEFQTLGDVKAEKILSEVRAACPQAEHLGGRSKVGLLEKLRTDAGTVSQATHGQVIGFNGVTKLRESDIGDQGLSEPAGTIFPGYCLELMRKSARARVQRGGSQLPGHHARVDSRGENEGVRCMETPAESLPRRLHRLRRRS